MSRSTIKSEAYLDIVWRQFRKNRAALASLWLLAPVFLVAIFAPLLASDQPLVFRDGEQTIFPWFRALFNPGNTVDYVYNMALVFRHRVRKDRPEELRAAGAVVEDGPEAAEKAHRCGSSAECRVPSAE